MLKSMNKFLLTVILILFSLSSIFGASIMDNVKNGFKNPDYTVYAFNAWDPSGAISDGLVSFTLNNPGEITYLSPLPSNEMIASFDFVNDVLIAFEHGTNKLYTVDIESGSFDLSSVLDISPNTIAYDDLTEKLYAIDNNTLYSFDFETGISTEIGPIGTTQGSFLVSCSDGEGNIYGISWGTNSFSDLYKIDVITGVGTYIGPLGILINFAQGMSYDKDAGVCYLAGFGGPSVLYDINTETGHATNVGGIMNGMELSAFAIPYGLSTTGNIAGNISLSGGTGNVEDAIITVGSETVSPNSSGDYSIELVEGVYSVSIELQDYYSQTIDGVVVNQGQTTDLDITLDFISGGTNVSGNVSGTWTLAGSPYMVTGQLTIPNGLTLTIEPGVFVIFEEFYKLDVKGQLLAIGTEDDFITFTAEDPNIRWNAIRFEDTPDTNPGSEIRYCDISYSSAVGTVQGGFSDGMGGGIAIINFDDVIVSDSKIHHNIADTGNGSPGGGGIAIRGCSPTITRCEIYSNHVEYSGGGGIMIFNIASPIISHNLIYNNESWDGGGIEIYYQCHPEIYNNTIVFNTCIGSNGAGGGIDFYNECEPTVTNNIIWGNQAPYGNQCFLYRESAIPNMYYNNIQGGLAQIGLNVGVVFAGDYENNIDADAQFVSVINSDFNLMSTSPCIDAGDPSFTNDPDGTVADIGALFYDQGNGIDDNYELSIMNYELKQNFPNPFNPTTRIDYELRITNYELAEIVVYNSIGQSVWSSGNLPFTIHNSSLPFDGSKFNSGIYYYSLVIDGMKMDTKSMVLIK